jgi:hypothetical protein
MKCDVEEGISCCSLLSLLLLPLGKSCISSRGSYKDVSLSLGVVIYGWIMFAQQQISQHETDRPLPLLSIPLKRCDVGYRHKASVVSFMDSFTLCFMKNRSVL